MRDDALAARVDDLQARALGALFDGDAADADDAFRDLKAIAEAESGRLTALLAQVMDAYRLLGERYRFLNQVPEREGPAPAQVLPLPATADATATGDVPRVRLLLARAARVDGAFRSRTTALVAAFNGASSTAALAKTLGLEPAD